MSEPIWTKEVWSIGGADSSDADGDLPFIDIQTGIEGTTGSRAVCEVSSSLVDDDFVLTAADWERARLIKEAPKLYEALRLLVHSFENPYMDGAKELAISRLGQAKDVLAKVRGETP